MTVFANESDEFITKSTGPMTYFGPKAFNASGAKGFTISLDVKLEKDAVFGIGGSTGKSFMGVLLDSKVRVPHNAILATTWLTRLVSEQPKRSV